jgi:hypothetical protein
VDRYPGWSVGGVFMVHTDPPVMFYTQVFALYEHPLRHVLHTGGGSRLWINLSPGCRVLDFTYTLRVVFYNRGDLSSFRGFPNL